MSQQRQRVNAIFIFACFNLHFAFQSFPSDKDTPRTGLCKKVKSCYPYFKIKDFPSEETWVMGLYDTCSYQSTRGRQVNRSLENRKHLNVRNKLSFIRCLVFVATTLSPMCCPRSQRTKAPSWTTRMRPSWTTQSFRSKARVSGEAAASEASTTISW